jgi:uncharacterized protein with beta-barrel porin domain
MALAASGALPLAFAAAPADAACVPNGAGVPNGATVTCTGTDTTGVGNGTQDNVTVNVQSGAAITLGDNATNINLHSSNTVNNGGALSAGNATGAGSGVTGINGTGTGNTFTSSGSITLGSALGTGSGVNGINGLGAGNITFTNSGSMTLGNAVGTGSGVDGMFGTGTGNTFTNSGSMTLGSAVGTGSGVDGMTGTGTGNTFTNSGSMTLGSALGSGSGVDGILAGSNNLITNVGSMTFGSASGTNAEIFGISANGFATITSSGNMTFGDASGGSAEIFGISANGNATIKSSGGMTFGGASGASAEIFGISANSNASIASSSNMTFGSASGGSAEIFGITVNGFATVASSGSMAFGNASGTNAEIFGVAANSNASITSTGNMTFGSATGMNAEIFGIAANSFSTINSSGNMTLGAASGTQSEILGISANDHATITRTGTMTIGDASGANTEVFGISANSNSTINISGNMTLGSASGPTSNVFGIVANTSSSVTNGGRLTLGSASAANTTVIGIDVFPASTVTNTGSVTVGDASGAGSFAAGIFGLTGTAVSNSGLVQVGANGFSVRLLGGGNTLNNSGTLDGMLSLGGAGNLATNSGLIEVTNAGTPLATNFGITGTFTQTSAGILALRVNSAGASDAMNVFGTANLGGTIRAVVLPGLYGNVTTYANVVTATNPITSQFGQAQTFGTAGLPLVFFSLTPVYHPNSVDLSLNRIGFGAVAGETVNEQRVGNSLNAAFSTTLTGNQALFFSNLLQATSVQALDNLSGEGTSGTQNTAFAVGDAFLGTMGQQADAWRNGGSAGGAGAAVMSYADTSANASRKKDPFNSLAAFKALPPPAFVPTWRGWIAGFGGSQSLNGDPVIGSARLSDRFAGGAIGFDYSGAPDWLVGLSGGASDSRFVVNDRFTNGSVQGGHVGAYGMKTFGSFYVEGLATYARFDNSTTRTILGVGPTETATGSFGSDQFGGRLEIGNTWRFGAIGVTPFAAIQAVDLRQSSYAESSVNAFGAPGILGLSYGSVNVTSVPSFLGVELDARVPVAGMMWSPYVRAAWEHEFHTTRQVTPTFLTLANLPGATFTVDGAPAARDSARVEAGSRLEITRNFALIAAFNGDFSGRGNLYAGTGGLRVSF